MLLISSYLFYAWGAPGVVPILFVLSVTDYLLSQHLPPTGMKSVVLRKCLLSIAIVLNLSVLFYYKYWNFFLTQWTFLFEQYGFSSIVWSDIVLPIGISFFTFQKISYLVDVYRGKAEPASTVIDYCLYVALFPQLIAGPIVRYHEIAEQLRERDRRTDDVTIGITRFCIGLAKKVLVADYLGQVADKVFLLPQGDLLSSIAWLGILAYTFQIYFDFSGYSDMAIGLGRLFGFRFPENFNAPYLARSIHEFWTRWHMTLSHWMREYLYIPLGGNRVSSIRTVVNLWIVFLLSGLWHGASWNFIVWGAFHGFWLTAERYRFLHLCSLNIFFSTLRTFIIIVFSWVLFRTENLQHAKIFFQALLGFGAVQPQAHFSWADIVRQRELLMLLVAILVCFLPMIRNDLSRSVREFFIVRPSGIALGTSSILLLLSLAALAALDYTPFLYFQF